MKQIWTCGGGTQSCAIAALIVQGRLEKPDFSIIADTGRETSATWNYLEKVLQPELAKVGVGIVKIKCSEWGGKLKTKLFWPGERKDNKPLPMIPAFTTDSGSVGKLSNFCTGKWKIEPMDRWLSQVAKVPPRNRVKWIGFSRDEQTRIVRMQLGKEFKTGKIRFPLLELGLNRRESIKLVEDMGWPTPPRSACWMCPNKSDHEWRMEKEDRPDEFEKAVKLEKELQEQDPDAWLHGSCKPLSEVDFTKPDDLFTRPCDSGLCFV